MIITLSNGKKTLIDDEDYHLVKPYKWNYSPLGSGYVIATFAKRTLHIHRLIMNAPEGIMVDHINHDGLDNRKNNLRLCTRSENMRNTHKRKLGTSRYKGVSTNSGRNGKPTPNGWKAEIMADKKRHYLGIFPTEELAALAYNKAALELHGDFASLNEI